ncbi:hypothetical protein [Actinoplanes sp. NPDC026623]|uniref:hypothetical protein n=1 Tax=Actinoplanes sp. NPDC026623 TaxID=3155610 RepID=UPI0033E1389E
MAARPAETGAAAADDTPPTTTAAAAERYVGPGGVNRARITVTAADEAGGSGVDRIEWLQPSDADVRFRPYTGALDLPATGTLYVRTVDREGNADPAYYGVDLGS